MEFELIYEYKDAFSTSYTILPLLCFVGLSLILIIKTQRVFFKHTFRKQVFLFILYASLFVSLLMTILLVSKMPQIVRSDNKLKNALRLEEYAIIEGEVTDYKLKEVNNQYFESFQIADVKFSYSDNVKVVGFHQTSKRFGPINSNGQYFRISYITREGVNLIIKIEAPVDR